MQSKDSDHPDIADSRSELAQDRTDLAEDRTLMANERTFAGWLRTGMSAVAIGLGFQVMFRSAEPVWVAKAAATLFIAIGVVIFVNAYRASRKVLARLDSHEAEPISRRHLAFVSGCLVIGSLALVAILWVF